MTKVKVGIVQMSCVKDKTANFQKAVEKIKEAVERAPRSFVFRSFLLLCIFVT